VFAKRHPVSGNLGRRGRARTPPLSTAQFIGSGPTRDKLVQEVERVLCVASATWQAVRLESLMCEMLNAVDADVTISADGFCKEEEDDADIPHDAFRQLMSFFVIIHKVVATAAWMQSKCSSSDQKAKPCIVDHKLKPEVERASVYLVTWLHDARAMVAAESWGAVRPVAAKQWLFPVQEAGKWLDLFEVVVSALHRALLKQCAMDAESVAMEVSKVTPQYDHVITDDKVTMATARQHILGWPTKQQLGDGAVQLFNSLAYISKMHKAWNLTPDISHDPDVGETIVAAQTVFGTARRAVAVIAALRIVAELKGQEQRSEACSLLAKKRSLIPKALAKMLEGVS